MQVLIVEDEQIIRNGIIKQMDWQLVGVSEVYSAENGERALELVEKYMPDIVISDIRMPGMTGIEFCTQIRKRNAAVQIIFISGYSDKEYLKSAIRLGAVNYVEKPISIKELTEAVQEAVIKKEHIEENINNRFHAFMVGKCDADAHLKRDMTQAAIILLKRKESGSAFQNLEEVFRMCVEKYDPNHPFTIREDALNRDTFIFLVAAKSKDMPLNKEMKDSVCQAFLDSLGEEERCFLGIGETIDSIHEIKKSYDSAVKALQVVSYKGWNHFAEAGERIREYQDTISVEKQNEFQKYISERNLEQVLLFLEKQKDELKEQKVKMGFHLKNDYYILDKLLTKLEQKKNKDVSCDYGFLNEAQTVDELYENVKNHAVRALAQCKEEQKTNFLIEQVICYMENHYASKDLSIKLLADEVYVTPTYLSNLFKKVTGQTIGQYLVEIRMRRAEELLKNPQYKMYQIAELVGYEDANYFAKTFKKKKGLLPSEFRDRNIMFRQGDIS